MQRTKQKTTAHSNSKSFTFITALPEKKEKLDLLVQSVKSLHGKNGPRFQLLLYTKGAIKKDYDEKVLIELEKEAYVKLIHDGSQLHEGLEESGEHYSIVFEATGLSKPLNFNSFFNIDRGYISPDKISIPHFRKNKAGLFKKEVQALIIPNTIAKYLLSSVSTYGFLDIKLLLKKSKSLKIETVECPLDINSPFQKKKNIGLLFRAFVNVFSFFYDWFIRTPLNELKSKPHELHSFIRERSIYRLVFVLLAFVLLLSMLLMGYDAGISGDEKTQYSHAARIYDYYASFGENKAAADATRKDKMAFYGSSFDFLTYVINKWLDINNPYEVRHLLNAFSGWLIILFCGLLAASLTNWRAAAVCMLLLFLSPRFLGHSFNNPKDIPFALGYFMTIYYLIRFLKEFPKPSITSTLWVAISIALAISIRIGGLLLAAYVVLFSFLYVFHRDKFQLFKSKKHIKRAGIFAIYVLLAVSFGMVLGILLWPYALENPLKNPFYALEAMEKFSVSIRQVFEGKNIWSNELPWYYHLKYMAISIPIVVFVGLLLFIYSLPQKMTGSGRFWKFLLAFTFLFPIAYIIYKQSNVYGGWRHILFVYPSIVVCSAIGFSMMWELKKKWAFYMLFAVLFILSLNPLRHIILNHPHQYIYYNEIFGGIKKAKGYFELDYYYHSLKEASEWLIEDLNLENGGKNDTIIVASNGDVSYYFRNYKPKVITRYARYYERGNHDWDYYICANSYINANQLRRNFWPPKNTVHQVEVDDVPVGVVIKRLDKNDYLGFEAGKKGDVSEAIKNLKKAIEHDPDNETALLNLSQIYNQTGQYDKAIVTANQCLKVYRGNERVLQILGIIHLNKKNFNEAQQYFDASIKSNNRFVSAYYYKALGYSMNNNLKGALSQLNRCLKVNGRFKPAYQLAGDILKKQGRTKEAEKYYNIAKSL